MPWDSSHPTIREQWNPFPFRPGCSGCSCVDIYSLAVANLQRFGFESVLYPHLMRCRVQACLGQTCCLDCNLLLLPCSVEEEYAEGPNACPCLPTQLPYVGSVDHVCPSASAELDPDTMAMQGLCGQDPAAPGRNKCYLCNDSWVAFDPEACDDYGRGPYTPAHICKSQLFTRYQVSRLSLHEAAILALKGLVEPQNYPGYPTRHWGVYVSLNQTNEIARCVSQTSVLIAPTPYLPEDDGIQTQAGMFALSRDGRLIQPGDPIMWYVGKEEKQTKSRNRMAEEGSEHNSCRVYGQSLPRSPRYILGKHESGPYDATVNPTIYGNLVHKANQACGPWRNACILSPYSFELCPYRVLWSQLTASRIIFPGDEICYWYGMTCSEGEEPIPCLCRYCQDPANPVDPISGGYLCAPFGF